jgi:DNA polymerase sigma
LELAVYGSFASNLEIESSDLDLVIKYQCLNTEINVNNINNNINPDHTTLIMAKLVECFKTLDKFEDINPIFTASVPVIKLVK